MQRAILLAPLDGTLLVKAATRLLHLIPDSLRLALLLHPVEPPPTTPTPAPGLLQKCRSKSSSSLHHRGTGVESSATDARVSYMSGRTSAPRGQEKPKEIRRPLSAGRIAGATRRLSSAPSSSPQPSLSSTWSARSPLIVPRSDSSSLSVSRLLHPSLKSPTEARSRTGREPAPSWHRSPPERPRSAPSARKRRQQEQEQPKKSVQEQAVRSTRTPAGSSSVPRSNSARATRVGKESGRSRTNEWK